MKPNFEPNYYIPSSEDERKRQEAIRNLGRLRKHKEKARQALALSNSSNLPALLKHQAI